jgi:hypothetical protein
MGTNQELLERLIPEYREVRAQSLEELTKKCRLIIITNSQYLKDKKLNKLLHSGKNIILDLNGKYRKVCSQERYQGLCW